MERREFDELLLKKRIILLDGRITEEKVDTTRTLLMILNQRSDEEIKLIIDSRGGDVHPGLWLFDAFKLSRAAVTGIVNGNCYSTALMILQGCKKRLATKHSLFRCHFIESNIAISWDDDFEEKLNVLIKDGQRAQRIFEEILAKRTGKTLEEIRALMKEWERKQITISAEEAKQFGFVDEVIEEYELF